MKRWRLSGPGCAQMPWRHCLHVPAMSLTLIAWQIAHFMGLGGMLRALAPIGHQEHQMLVQATLTTSWSGEHRWERSKLQSDVKGVVKWY